MTIYSKLFIGGSLVDDNWNYNVNKSIGENNQSSNFDAVLKNYAGVNTTNYNIGDEVVIYADLNATNGSPSTRIFTGILEDKEFSGSEENERLMLAGRDYSARLMDRTVEPEVYTNLPAGSIVKDIIVKYSNNITTTNIHDSPFIVDRITFNQMPVFDAIKKLADLADYTFYVDENKDLHFEEKASISSSYTFDNTNILKANFKFKEQRDTVYNQVWVYGDRYLDGYKETFTTNGGSAYSLLYNPHNTSIVVNSTGIQPGGVYGMVSETTSGLKYLVNYNDKYILFTSGISLGNNIPKTGSTMIITYDRSLPIVKVGDNETSKALYGTRIKVITDKDIKDPATAEQILVRELEKSETPKKQGNIDVKGVVNIIPGQTCIVNVPYYNIINQEYDILEADYQFNKENNLSDSVLSLKLNKKLPDITDTMKDIMLGLKKLQSADITDSDFITRYQYTTGSFGVRTSGLVVWTRTIGSSFILSHPINSLLGSYANHNLGDYRLGSSLQFSGGYF